MNLIYYVSDFFFIVFSLLFIIVLQLIFLLSFLICFSFMSCLRVYLCGRTGRFRVSRANVVFLFV